MLEIEEDLIAMKVEKEEKLFVIDATILDILWGIAEHLIISAIEEIEEMYLYANCVINLDTQQSFVEWIEETLTKNRITKETIEEVMIV